MSKTLENLTISGAQLEVLRDSKPYGKAYFDVESGSWRIDFYEVKENGSSALTTMMIRFIKVMLSGADTTCLDLFMRYSDNLFTYSLCCLGGLYGHGFVTLTPIKK